MKQPPTPAEVDRIAALADPVVRNLQITQCYHELSSAFSERSGAGANWCTFATWASRQAGQTIRREDFDRALEAMLADTMTTREAAEALAEAAARSGIRREKGDFLQKIWKAINPRAAMDRAGDAVGRGNQKVFAEIGREFARFAAECQQDEIHDDERLTRFLEALRPGEPPEGQRYLRQAFTRYYAAFFENDAKAKAELLLLANLEIGLHEQTRLQPEIAEALNASVGDPGQFTRRLLGELFPYRGWLAYAILLFLRLIGRTAHLDAAIERLLEAARGRIRLFLTEHMMTLELPHGRRLRLGDDLKAAFPPSLREIAGDDLRALLAQIDPTRDSLHETGARDWSALSERLHFIADLFRCYHEQPDLLEAPFSAAETAAIVEGRWPPAFSDLS